MKVHMKSHMKATPIVQLIKYISTIYNCTEQTARNTIDKFPETVQGSTQRVLRSGGTLYKVLLAGGGGRIGRRNEDVHYIYYALAFDGEPVS